MFATANKQTCDFGLPKSGFFRHFLGRTKKWHPSWHSAARQLYARPEEKSIKLPPNKKREPHPKMRFLLY